MAHPILVTYAVFSQLQGRVKSKPAHSRSLPLIKTTEPQRKKQTGIRRGLQMARKTVPWAGSDKLMKMAVNVQKDRQPYIKMANGHTHKPKEKKRRTDRPREER